MRTMPVRLTPRSLCSVLLACAVSGASVSAQLLVDPNGGGTHTDLQAALDAARPHATIRVNGGSWSTIQVSKSVSIIGSRDNRPRISVPSRCQGIAHPAAITLNGLGTDRFVLDSVDVSGSISGIQCGVAGPALRGRGFSQIRIVNSVLLAPEWYLLTGFASGAPGIELAAAPNSQLMILNSTVRGSASKLDPNWSFLDGFGQNGPAGVSAPTWLAVVLDSQVRGGEGAGGAFFSGPPTSAPCPCSGSGSGGVGIVAESVVSADSTITGGLGGGVFASRDVGQTWIGWGKQPDGPAVAAQGGHRQLGDGYSIPESMRVGRNWSMFFPALRHPASTGILFLGRPRAQPLFIGSDVIFLDLPVELGSLSEPATAYQLPIPDVVALAGVEVGVQMFRMGLRVASGWDRPVIEVIGW